VLHLLFSPSIKYEDESCNQLILEGFVMVFHCDELSPPPLHIVFDLLGNCFLFQEEMEFQSAIASRQIPKSDHMTSRTEV